jgi:hypothetical protein
MVVDRKDKDGLRDALEKFRPENYDRDEIRRIATSYAWDNVVKPVVDLYAS